MTKKTIKVSWKDIEQILKNILDKSFVKPDIIIAIQRGGLVPATILSHLLNIRDISIVSSISTIDDTIYSIKKPPLVKHNIPIKDLKDKNILIVDDIIGSGLTMSEVTSVIKKYNPLSIKILTCYLNLDNWEKNQELSPEQCVDYIGRVVRGWVVFPWEN